MSDMTMKIEPVLPMDLGDDPFAGPLWRVYQSDATERLKDLNSESVHCIITDPPYNSLEEHREIGTTARLDDWFEVVGEQYWRPLFLQLFRVLKSGCHAYVFCDQQTLPTVRDATEFAGFKYWKFLVWDKGRIGMGYHYRAQHELICLLSKNGFRELRDRSVGDVLQADPVRGGYPTEKPVDLLETLVTQSTGPGQMVLDPFCGSGAVGEAALRNGRRFMGADIADRAVDLSRQRLSDVREEVS